jgi:peptidoglycan DL-endopeptidase LytE
MTRVYNYGKNLAMALVLAGGMMGMASIAQAQTNSGSTIRNAQEQLKTDGYYNGAVDGVDGPATRAAIRKYQSDNQLTVNGRLDQATCNKLGLGSGEANRTANNPGNNPSSNTQNNPANNNMQPNTGTNSPSTVMAAQRNLHQKGFYKGAINGEMNGETRAAIREFQKNSNLSVTGQLDSETLNSLGVSK